MLGIIQLIRPKNLLLIALLQCFVLYGLGPFHYLWFNLFKTSALLLSTGFIAAAGYIINDYFDVKIDQINKPEKVVIGNKLKRRWAIILHISLTILGLLCAWYVNLKTLAIAALCALLLYTYSSSFKKKFLTGNLVIALLAALSVIICKAYILELDNIKIIAYSFFAAFTTLIREIIKDVEDEKGDALFQGNTLVINLGLRHTKRIIYFSTLFLLVAVLVYPIIALNLIYNSDIFFWAYTIYLIIGVVLPLLLFLLRLKSADKKSDFAWLSRRMKIIMLIGVFSILLC